MDSIPFKKPKLELPKTNVDKGGNVLSEEIIVECMAIADDEGESYPCEKESKVDRTQICNSSISDKLIEKECHSNEIPKQNNIDFLFQRYELASDKTTKKKKITIVPSQYHEWGFLSKIKERSCTLGELTDGALKNMGNCKETFIQILNELQFDYSVVELKSLKPTEVQCIFVFDIKSNPNFTFCGFGATEDIAIQEAAKKGLEFFFESCQ